MATTGRLLSWPCDALSVGRLEVMVKDTMRSISGLLISYLLGSKCVGAIEKQRGLRKVHNVFIP